MTDHWPDLDQTEIPYYTTQHDSKKAKEIMAVATSVASDTSPALLSIPLTAVQQNLSASAQVAQFETIPLEVEAVQFQGWSNAADIFNWGLPALFVPIGYNHPLRYKTEFDNDTEEVLDNAEEFLVVRGAHDDAYRIDLYNWIVKTSDGKFAAFTETQFNKTYRPVSEGTDEVATEDPTPAASN